MQKQVSNTIQKYFFLSLLLLTALHLPALAQSPFPMASGTYSENFDRIATWGANFTTTATSGNSVTRFSAAAPESPSTLPNQNTVFTSSGGVQRASTNNKIVLYATGTSSTTQNAAAFDLNLNFANTTAGTLSFNYNSVNTGAGNRQAVFSIRTNIGTGGAFVTLPQTTVTITNNAPNSGVIRVALPAGFSNNATAKIRFYLATQTGTVNNGTSGSRPRMAIDNVRATATYNGTNPNVVTTGTVAQTIFNVTATNPGASFTVPYTSTGTFTGTWQVQLSNEEGIFNPDETANIIGTGTGSSPITAQIPAGTNCGTGYRVRVLNTAPLRFGNANSANITVNFTPAANTVTLDNNDAQTLVLGATGNNIAAASTASSTFAWQYRAGTSGAYTPIPGATADNYTLKASDFPAPGSYQLIARATAINACNNVVGSSTPVSVQVSGVSVSPASLTFPTTGVGRESAASAVTITGSGLTGNVTVTPPAGFEISLGGQSQYTAGSISIASLNGAINAVIDVRFVPLAAQAYSGNITVASNINTATLAVSGTGTVALPILTSRPATSVTATSAITGGDISSAGGAAISAKGVVYSISSNPALQNGTDLNSGTGTAGFTSSLAGLVQNQLYYVRAYATNSAGTAYGNQVQFTTLPAAPTQQSANITFPGESIEPYQVKISWVNGNGAGTLVKISKANNITNPVNGLEYTANSAYYSSEEQVVFVGDNTQDFVTVTGLEPGMQYFFRVFSFNNQGAATMYNTDGDAVSVFSANSPAPTPLPVTLVYFRGMLTTEGVQLKWLTASEINSSHFNISRSTDGKHYKTVGTVKSAGTTTTDQLYTFEDKLPASGIYYYQLEQVDFDGKSEKFNVVTINKGSNLNQLITAYPNPAADELTVNIPASGIVSYTIVNASGNTLVSKKVSRLTKENLKVTVSELPAGPYVLIMQPDNGTKQVVRFIKTGN